MAADVLYRFAYSLCVLGIALFTTLLVELPIAAAFRIGRRALGVVLLINVLTNPALNLLLVVLANSMGLPPETWVLFYMQCAAVLLLEIIVVVVEWRLMVWAFQGTVGTSRKLLLLSVIMNAFSAIFGTVLVYFLVWLLLGNPPV